MSSSQIDRQVLEKIEDIESQNASVGVYEFVNTSEICRETQLGESMVREVLSRLQQNRQIIWDQSSGVRSRTAHILFCLLNCEALSRNQPPQRNVSDLKYIRYVKRVPKYVVDLSSQKLGQSFESVLKYSELESQYGAVVSECLAGLSIIYPRISQFQMKSALQILRILEGADPNKGLVLVADTGAGKSLAYQLPLLLKILTKKMDAYRRRMKHVNCTALLVFPRNVLAQDQFSDLLELSQLLHQRLERLRLTNDFRNFLSFRIVRDFGGPSKEELSQAYESSPDIIVTNSEALKRRLLNPVAHQVYRDGVDMVLYDEIHLYYGLHGAFVSGLNARLESVLPKAPAFVGMSATIAKPEKHCQRLFALPERPNIISDRDDVLESKVIEHHVILKPRPGRPPLGVAIDATSCLLHNRRDGVTQSRNLPVEERPKTICFSDSLDQSGRWTYDQNEDEYFDPPRNIPPANFFRGYPVYFRPQTPVLGDACADCHSGRDIICSNCPSYQNGRCWWFSLDSGDPGTWRRFGTFFIPDDNIRSRRLTSREVEFDARGSVYDLFRSELVVGMGRNRIPLGVVDVDNIVATSVLEVGVDFRGIKEIVMLGEIQSPTSYKQKAGRGAREGNTSDGLFVMTVVPPMPLANFYYRHFYRLVNPALSPVPLEPTNPDSLKSHAFASVFDFLARQGINVFNVIDIKNDEAGVEADFEKAVDVLRNSANTVEAHVQKFLRNLGVTDDDITRTAVRKALDLLEQLYQPIELEGDTKKFINWVFSGSRDPQIFKSLHEKTKADYDSLETTVSSSLAKESEFVESGTNLTNALIEVGGTYEQWARKLGELFEKVRK